MPISDFKPTNSCLREDGQSFELQPLNKPKSPKQGNSILRPITPEILKDYLTKEKGFNFSSYNQKEPRFRLGGMPQWCDFKNFTGGVQLGIDLLKFK